MFITAKSSNGELVGNFSQMFFGSCLFPRPKIAQEVLKNSELSGWGNRLVFNCKNFPPSKIFFSANIFQSTVYLTLTFDMTSRLLEDDIIRCHYTVRWMPGDDVQMWRRETNLCGQQLHLWWPTTLSWWRRWVQKDVQSDNENRWGQLPTTQYKNLPCGYNKDGQWPIATIYTTAFYWTIRHAS